MANFQQVMQSLPKKEDLCECETEEIISILHRLITATTETGEQKFIIFNVIRIILHEQEPQCRMMIQEELDRINDLIAHILDEYLRYMKEIPKLKSIFDAMFFACYIDTAYIEMAKSMIEIDRKYKKRRNNDPAEKIIKAESAKMILNTFINGFPHNADPRVKAQFLKSVVPFLFSVECYKKSASSHTPEFGILQVNTLATPEFTPQEKQKFIHSILQVIARMKRDCPQYKALYYEVETILRNSGQVRM